MYAFILSVVLALSSFHGHYATHYHITLHMVDCWQFWENTVSSNKDDHKKLRLHCDAMVTTKAVVKV